MNTANSHQYDAIVVGARVAGSPTAMLLAQKGYRVLLVDRDSFPSDTMSTHQVQIPGGVMLKRWGLLDRVLASNCPLARNVSMDMGPFKFKGTFPPSEGVEGVYSPRRYILDKILVDAAVEAGVELREKFIVEEILMEDGRVIGIRGRAKGGAVATERAKVVIGADGRHSKVAAAVSAPKYHEYPALTCAYYTYFSDLPLQGGELYGFDHRLMGAWPTNDNLTMIYIAWPVSEFARVRADIEGNFMKTIDLTPEFAGRVRHSKRVERFVGTAELPNFFRKPYGPGWALVGDAGYIKDPITGSGIGDAFRDSQFLADALDDGFAGRAPMDEALARYERRRNEAAMPLYKFTVQLAAMQPPAPEQVALFSALMRNQEAANRFFGVTTGSVPVSEFFSPKNMFRILGVGGMMKLMVQKMFTRQRSEIA